MDKHLLAENPMRPHEGGLCIIRTVKPIAIFEVHEDHVNTGKYQKHYTFEDEDFTFSMHHYFVEGILSVEEASIQNMYKHMDDAWYWFKAYMQWEDERFDESGGEAHGN